jgi:hypothetical protein
MQLLTSPLLHGGVSKAVSLFFDEASRCSSDEVALLSSLFSFLFSSVDVADVDVVVILDRETVCITSALVSKKLLVKKRRHKHRRAQDVLFDG